MVAVLLLILGVILFLVIAIAVYIFNTQRTLVNLDELCKNAMSQIAVQLNSRWDALLALAKTAAQYSKHESETLEKVIAARNSGATQTTEQRMEEENQITGALRQIFALSENYPDLKANQNFLDLQGQLKSIEADIANARKYYNGAVKEFNNACEQVPSNIVANMFHFERKPMFEVKEEAERENVKVEF